jgi:hypothetical protein
MRQRICTAILGLALAAGIAAPNAGAAVPRDFIGIASNLADLPDIQAATMRQQAAYGIGLERQPFRWRDIETSPGVYDFSVYDAFMRTAATNGLAVLPILVDTPDFYAARIYFSNGVREISPPTTTAPYQAFVAATVERYGPNGTFWSDNPDVPYRPIRSWQMWNEECLAQYWEPRPDPAAYVKLLKAGYLAVKAIDAGAEVVSGGMPNNSRQGIPFNTYATAMLKAGAYRYFNTFAIHPYATQLSGVISSVASTRRLLDRYHAKNAKIWATEIGWASAGPASPFNVGTRGQASRLSGIVADFAKLRGRYKIRGVVIYNWRDDPLPASGHDFFGLHTGLLDYSGHAKPSYSALKSAIRAARR